MIFFLSGCSIYIWGGCVYIYKKDPVPFLVLKLLGPKSIQSRSKCRKNSGFIFVFAASKWFSVFKIGCLLHFQIHKSRSRHFKVSTIKASMRLFLCPRQFIGWPNLPLFSRRTGRRGNSPPSVFPAPIVRGPYKL